MQESQAIQIVQALQQIAGKLSQTDHRLAELVMALDKIDQKLARFVLAQSQQK